MASVFDGACFSSQADWAYCSSGTVDDYMARHEWNAAEKCDYCGRTQVYPVSGQCAGCGAAKPSMRPKPRTPWSATYGE